ncbi:DUF7285 family protein [Halobaculum marinum]|uniref:Uncharacterized protein n=1 Tax=Halobaculum marinum TaxID=3031996 RepID=A0ABD5X1K1_9EURY|nr:hypothetical protein [Halobaculum sp. DT55]
MSRSSSSRERGLAEPSAALAAVLAVSVGLSAYALVLDGAATGGGPAAEPLLERVHDRTTVGGVADPDRFVTVGGGALTGEAHANATLAVAGRRWSVGATPPDRADGGGPTGAVDRAVAARRVGVALGPGRVRPGELRVVVWR